ncbi:MAG: hypothetical protein JXB62_19810 [Pirellulales bacterium]|nr:hypothetical protein [Pirellulales bacterium]
MPIASSDDPRVPEPDTSPRVALSAVVILSAAMAAAWIASGSIGLLAHPLRHALTWVALGVAIVSGLPRRDASWPRWALLVAAVLAGLVMTAASLPAVNVLAVALVLAALVGPAPGLQGRVVATAALAVVALGIFRTAQTSIPVVWLAADAVGEVFGRLAGRLAGEPLWIGSLFGGVDFLVLMAALYVGWLLQTAPPRWPRALYAAAAILLGHLLYLVVLAFSNRLLAALPDPVLPEITDINQMGVWTWGNAARSLLPWNLPVLAGLVHVAIAVAMFRWARWPAESGEAPEPDMEKGPSQTGPPRRRVQLVLQYGPGLLAVLIPIVTVLGLSRSTLKGKTVVAYAEGYVNWNKPEHRQHGTAGEPSPQERPTDPARRDAPTYGTLRWFVESLGGRLLISNDLSEQDLAAADVLLLIHPDRPWPEETLKRVKQYVDGGGALLVAAEPTVARHAAGQTSRSSFNDVLSALGAAVRVRDDTAVAAVAQWEHALQPLAHPATEGIDDRRNHFGLVSSSSIEVRWPARPLLVGRFGFGEPGDSGAAEYDSGEELGDLVLAAEQRIGRGRVVVLGGAAALRDDFQAVAYPTTGRLLAYLADKPGSPQDWWRQTLGLLAMAALVGLLFWQRVGAQNTAVQKAGAQEAGVQETSESAGVQPAAQRAAAIQVAVVAAALAVSLVCCVHLSLVTGRVLPDGKRLLPNQVAYIDASHLEAYSSDTWDAFGIGGLGRTLIRNGFLPLLLPELSPKRLEGAKLLISIGPGRRFSAADRQAVKRFVEAGGTFLCMVGAEQARASRELLGEFGFYVPTSPVPPSEIVREPAPLGMGYFRTLYFNEDGVQASMLCYSSWEVICTEQDGWKMAQWSDGITDVPFVVSRPVGRGTVAVIADTYVATNQNLETAETAFAENVDFWRWFLSRVTDRPPWTPSKQDEPKPPSPPDRPAAEAVPADDSANREAAP